MLLTNKVLMDGDRIWKFTVINIKRSKRITNPGAIAGRSKSRRRLREQRRGPGFERPYLSFHLIRLHSPPNKLPSLVSRGYHGASQHPPKTGSWSLRRRAGTVLWAGSSLCPSFLELERHWAGFS